MSCSALPDANPQERSFQVRFASLFHGRVLPESEETTIVLQTNCQDARRIQMAIGFRQYVGENSRK